MRGAFEEREIGFPTFTRKESTVKTTRKALLLILLLAPASLALGQREGTMHIGHHRSIEAYEQAVRMIATPAQRMAFAKCMEAMERLRGKINQMPRIGSPWSRSRVSYSSNDLDALSDLREQLETALTDLTATHQEFRKGMTDAQRRELARRLSKLEHLQAQLNSGASQLDHDLTAARPGPASPNVSWDVNSIKGAAGKWRSEHRKIAKEMGIQQ